MQISRPKCLIVARFLLQRWAALFLQMRWSAAPSFLGWDIGEAQHLCGRLVLCGVWPCHVGAAWVHEEWQPKLPGQRNPKLSSPVLSCSA